MKRHFEIEDTPRFGSTAASMKDEQTNHIR